MLIAGMSVMWLGFATPVTTYAASTTFTLQPVGTAGDTNATQTFANLTNRGISIILFVGGAAAVLYLLWSGFLYVTAGGDDEKAGKARKGVVNAIIGIVIISAAFLIFNASRKVVNSASINGSPTDL